jgi:excisionase family DNA binding protein
MQVTIAEAARILGVPEKTVRRQVRNGELPGTQTDTPQGFRWMIELPDGEPQQENHSESYTALRELVSVLREELTVRDRQLEAKDQQLVAKDKQIEQLHVLLQQAQAALPAPRDNLPWWQRLWRRG